MSPGDPAIDVRDLTKRYGSTAAVDRVTFSVPAGSVTGFLGPNGAGKTTTMRVLLGLAAPTSGQAHVLGTPYGALDVPLRRVGAALEITGFHPGRTARDHLRILCLQGGLDDARTDAVLSLTGMAGYAGAKVKGFSFGMRQRLALAAALLGEPEVLVLDEPANGLDPAGVAWLRAFLHRFAESGGAVLISSHILSEIAEVADRVVVIDRGALVTQGSVRELTSAAGEAVIVRSPDIDRLRPALGRAGAFLSAVADGSLAVRNLPIEDVGRIAADEGAVLHELRREVSTLEDAFLALTGGVAVTRLIGAELLKVRTTRLWIGLAIGGLALVTLATVAVLLVAGTAEGLAQGLGPITSVEDVRTLVWSGAAMSFFAVVLAATMATGEHRYGTAASTYLTTPSRPSVITAKIGAAIPLGAAYGLVGGVVPLVIAAVWFAAKGDALPLGPGVPIAVFEVVLQCAYGAALAVCAGAAIRSQLVAILGLLGWIFVAEPLASALVPAIKRWAPFTGVQGAFGPPDPRVFGHLAAGGLMVLYVVSVAYAAIWLEQRRDV